MGDLKADKKGGGPASGGGGVNLMHSYYLYAAILAIKLLALVPMSNVVCNPEKIQRANLSDLKHLTPFWLVAALYMTTQPDKDLAINLLRGFVVARIVAAIGYVVKIPKQLVECAYFVSFAITTYMSAFVIYAYKNAI